MRVRGGPARRGGAASQPSLRRVSQRKRVFLVLAFGFVLLGLGVTVPSVAWPSIAETFQRPLADLGFVTLLFGGGYTASTLLSGRLAAKARTGPTLIAAAAIASVALTMLTASATWSVFLIAAGLLGLAAGLVDAATNTYVAIRRGARAMGFLHGAFGIGAIAGPLLVAGMLQIGLSWRAAFAALAVGQAVYALGLWLFARTLDVRSEPPRIGQRARLLRSPVLVWSLIVFFVYLGLAAGTGVWAFTYLSEGRGISSGLSGLVVAAYWAAFTASRLALGAVGERIPSETILRWAAASTAAALAFFWWNPVSWVGVAALIFSGFAHGPVFPLEVLLTPRRFGAALTATVVGYEMAAANVGGALLPGAMGFAVGGAGLAAIPPLLLANALLLWAAIEMLRRQSRLATAYHTEDALKT